MAPAEPIATGAALPAPAFIHTPLRDDAAWVAAFDRLDIPVLATTADAVEEWRANEDAADAHLLADAMSSDPLMTLKLLRHVAMLRRGRDQSDAETATEALVMLGITDASAMRSPRTKPPRPSRTRNSLSTTASGSSSRPMRAVPTG